MNLKDMLAPFNPTNEQMLVKARLQAALEERDFAIDAESLGIEAMENLSGCKKLKKWASENPSFIGWLLDKDLTKHKVQAFADVAVDMLYDIMMSDLEPKVMTAKDKIAAANLLLQLADRFPSKKREIQYIDKELGRLDSGETERKIAEYQLKLASGPDPKGRKGDAE